MPQTETLPSLSISSRDDFGAKLHLSSNQSQGTTSPVKDLYC